MAKVEYYFSKKFILDEKRLLKIEKIIKDRLKNHPVPVIYEFIVLYDDGFQYSTDKVNDVIVSDEISWRRIYALDIQARSENDFIFFLNFSNSGTLINIQGANKDEVSLLDKELREYLTTHVNIYMDFSSRASQPFYYFSVVLGLIFLGLWGLFRSTINVTVNTEELNSILVSNNLVDKINFLIKQSTNSAFKLSATSLLWFCLLIFAVACFLKPYLGFLDYFFPRNILLFGYKKEEYERRQKIFGKLFWGIIIAFVIGTLGSIVASYIVTQN